MTHPISHPISHRILGITTAAVLTMGLTACGSGSDDSPAASGDQPSRAPGGQGGQGFPGANGEVVAIDGSTAQVRGQQSGQVAVSWTDATTFTRTVAGKAGDIEVGDCVMVMGSAEDTDAAASTVRVTEPVDGSCVAGAPGGTRGDRPELPDGAPTNRPDGAPSDPPEGAPGRGGRGGLVAGKVTKVSDGSLTVAAMSFAPRGSDDDGASEPATEDRTVLLDADTRVTTSADAAAGDVKVGLCVSAQGARDDAGAVTATTVSISEKVDDACGLGGFGPGRGGSPTGGDSDA